MFATNPFLCQSGYFWCVIQAYSHNIFKCFTWWILRFYTIVQILPDSVFFSVSRQKSHPLFAKQNSVILAKYLWLCCQRWVRASTYENDVTLVMISFYSFLFWCYILLGPLFIKVRSSFFLNSGSSWHLTLCIKCRLYMFYTGVTRLIA